jgi:hypothetical protein
VIVPGTNAERKRAIAASERGELPAIEAEG